MTGEFINATKNKQATGNITTIEGVGGTQLPNTPTGLASHIGSFFYNTQLEGEPRRDNLFLIRLLGQTAVVEMLKDIIKKQVASTDFNIKIREDIETNPELQNLARELEHFFDGNFNTNDTTWTDLMEMLLDDILDIDSGVLELIPDENGKISQMIPRDGATFTKNVQDTGLLPLPDSDEPAYYQFSLSSRAQNLFSTDFQGVELRNLIEELRIHPFRPIFKETKKFSRDQIVWFMENPTTYSSYGRGRTQKIKRVTEIILNGDRHRNKFFTDNEIHKGFLNVTDELSQQSREDLKNKFKRSRGNEYEIPVVGGSQAEWVSMDPSPSKMQFLESHKFYLKVAIMAYGLNEAEAGNHENANLSVSEEMKFNIFRRTTQPLLSMIENKFNNEILPYTKEQAQANGALTASFSPSSKFLRKLDQEVEEKDLSLGVTTINELRSKQGKEDYGPLGDLPQNVLNQLSQQHPGYVAESMNPDIDDAPEPVQPGLTLTNPQTEKHVKQTYKRRKKQDKKEDEVVKDVEDIDLTPPNAVVNAAQAAIDFEQDNDDIQNCGTGRGDQRAKQITENDLSWQDFVTTDNGTPIPAYLESHEEDVTAEGPPTDWTYDEMNDCGNRQYAKWGGTGTGTGLEWAQSRKQLIEEALEQQDQQGDSTVPRGIGDVESYKDAWRAQQNGTITV